MEKYLNLLERVDGRKNNAPIIVKAAMDGTQDYNVFEKLVNKLK